MKQTTSDSSWEEEGKGRLETNMLAIYQHCWYQISLILDWIPRERDSKTEM